MTDKMFDPTKHDHYCLRNNNGCYPGNSIAFDMICDEKSEPDTKQCPLFLNKKGEAYQYVKCNFPRCI